MQPVSWLSGAMCLAGALSLIPASVGAGPIQVSCRDGGSRAVVVRDGRRLADPGLLCDRDGAPDGACTFDLLPTCLACRFRPVPPHENEGPGCTCFRDDSPCNERYIVAVGPRRRTGRAVRRFGFGKGRIVLRCRPARRSAAGATTSTTLPDPSSPVGIWELASAGEVNTCPAGTTSPVETTRMRIARSGDHLVGCGGLWHDEQYLGDSSASGFTLDFGRNGCCSVGCGDPSADSYRVIGKLTATSIAPDTLALTQDWSLFPLAGLCSPCQMTWTGTMTRLLASP